MEVIIDAKTTSYGTVVLKQSGTNYNLYVNNSLIIVTSDLKYALSEYNKY